MNNIFFLILFLIPFITNAIEYEHDGYLIKYKSDLTFKKIDESQLNKYKNNKNIEYIEPNYIYHTFANDVKWDMTKIKADKAWKIEDGSSNEVIVAVIDTGIDYKHEDLKYNIWSDNKGNHGYDFANNDSDPMDDNGHGTHCSGTIGAMHNNYGISGVSANVKIMGLKFLDFNGSGSLNNAVKSIKYAVDHGAKILSNSWGGGGYSKAMFDVINYAKKQGVLFIAASGNDGSKNPMYPASYDLDNIISVAASDLNDKKASFSNK